MGLEPIPHLRIQRADHHGSTVVVVEGEIDLATATAVEKALRKAADEGISVVDLTGVTFIDSRPDFGRFSPPTRTPVEA